MHMVSGPPAWSSTGDILRMLLPGLLHTSGKTGSSGEGTRESGIQKACWAILRLTEVPETFLFWEPWENLREGSNKSDECLEILS